MCWVAIPWYLWRLWWQRFEGLGDPRPLQRAFVNMSAVAVTRLWSIPFHLPQGLKMQPGWATVVPMSFWSLFILKIFVRIPIVQLLGRHRDSHKHSSYFISYDVTVRQNKCAPIDCLGDWHDRPHISCYKYCIILVGSQHACTSWNQKVHPWAAVVIGMIGAFVYSATSRALVRWNVATLSTQHIGQRSL